MEYDSSVKKSDDHTQQIICISAYKNMLTDDTTALIKIVNAHYSLLACVQYF